MDEDLSPELRRLLSDLMVQERLVIAAGNAGLFAEVDAAEVKIADITTRIRAYYGHQCIKRPRDPVALAKLIGDISAGQIVDERTGRTRQRPS